MIALNSYLIENFRSYGPKQRVPLRKINFLFGPNSHGKSTALTALSILANYFMKRKFTVSKIEHVDNSPDIVLRDNVINNLSGKDTFTLSCEFLTSDKFDRQLILEPSFELENLSDGRPVKFSLFEHFEGEKDLFFELKDDLVTINFDSYYYRDSLRTLNYSSRKVDEKDPFDKGEKTYESIDIDWLNLRLKNPPPSFGWSEEFQMQTFIKDDESVSEKRKIVQFLNNEIDKLFGLFQFSWQTNLVGWIGPNRTILNNNISVNHEKGFIDDRFLNKKAIDKMNDWLKSTDTIDIPYQFVLHESYSKAGLLVKEYGLIDQDSGNFLTLYEVGSGIAHIFLILLAFFNDLVGLIIQQPEIHLHPALQVQLARAMIELTNEKKGDEYFQLIIETHSEHFIKAAQLEIARNLNSEESNFKKEFLSVLYISKDKSRFSKVKQMELDETGAFTEPWPDDFFELSADLSLERLRQSYKSKN